VALGKGAIAAAPETFALENLFFGGMKYPDWQALPLP
jgi:hypothetical protein